MCNTQRPSAVQSNGSKRARTVVPAGRLKQTITESHKAQDTLFFNSPQQSHTQSRQSQNEIKTETVTHASRQADTGRHSQNEIKTETVTRGTRHAIHLPPFPNPHPSPLHSPSPSSDAPLSGAFACFVRQFIGRVSDEPVESRFRPEYGVDQVRSFDHRRIRQRQERGL